MAENVADSVKYYVRVDRQHQTDLAPLRHWPNLKVAFEKDEIWLTEFTAEQVNSVQVKQLPYKTLFYARKGKLFGWDSRLPERNEPTFLWTPIERAFPLKLSGYNHNFFGVNQSLTMRLVPSERMAAPELMLTSLETLKGAMENIPAIRLKAMDWVLINENQALIKGSRMLPVNGQVFWAAGAMMLPVGYDFELHILAREIEQKLNPDKEYWIIWREDSTYFKVPKTALKPLTISSFRKSYLQHREH